MRFFQYLTVSGLCLLFLLFPPKTQAIVILPALVLLPVVKLVALIMVGLSVPFAGIGFFWKTLTKHRWRDILFGLLGLVVVLALLIAIVLKLTNPDRPWF